MLIKVTTKFWSIIGKIGIKDLKNGNQVLILKDSKGGNNKLSEEFAKEDTIITIRTEIFGKKVIKTLTETGLFRKVENSPKMIEIIDKDSLYV